MNLIHFFYSLKARRRQHWHPSHSSGAQKLWPSASKWLGLALTTGSACFAAPLPAAAPLAWGWGYYGQLGDGTFYTTGNVGVATPVQVSGLSGVVTIAGGYSHSMALKSDGTVWAWGAGYSGQLGDGNFYTTGNQGVAAPIQVTSLSGIVAISGGGYHNLALKSDGTVWAWGQGYYGQLGDGNFYTTGNQGVATPIPVSGLSDVVAIAGGFSHSAALKSDGTVWTWGLGPLPNQRSATPVQVGGLSNVVAIAAGFEHHLALKSDGTVWAWGIGFLGQLGDGNFYTDPPYGVATPVQVSGLSNIQAIACGGYHNLALQSDSQVRAWGFGRNGQLGDLSIYDDPPFGVATPTYCAIYNVRAIACGLYHNLALLNDETVWAWGYGLFGELGDGNFSAVVAEPILASGLSQPVSAIAAGSYHSFALPAVVASIPPVITCPSDMDVSNDPGQCSAVVNYPAPGVSGGTGNVVVVCNPPSGSVFPVGTTTVNCTATDAAGNSATCNFNVTVHDTEPPLVSYVVVKAPVLLANPRRSVGWFRLQATDNCDPDPLIYLKGSLGNFVAGPFHSGVQVEIGRGLVLIPRQLPSTFGGNVATIQLNGDVLLWAVDASGNATTPIKCK